MTLKSVPYSGAIIIHTKTGGKYTFEEELLVKMGDLWVSHCSYRDVNYKKYARDFSNFMTSFSLEITDTPE